MLNAAGNDEEQDKETQQYLEDLTAEGKLANLGSGDALQDVNGLASLLSATKTKKTNPGTRFSPLSPP